MSGPWIEWSDFWTGVYVGSTCTAILASFLFDVYRSRRRARRR